MAVVNVKSNLFRNEATAGAVIDSKRVRGRIKVAVGSVSNAADDSSGSTYLLARIPSHAIMLPRTQFDVENTGFAAIRIGTLTDVDALVAVLKSAGNTVTPFAFGDANHGKELWEVLGLAADPGGMIGIYQHAIAGATGAGSMPFIFEWVEN